jgi:hypothetical protein
MFFSIFVAKLKPFFSSGRRHSVEIAYAGTLVVFLWVCSQFYIPGQGFTALIEFGAKEEARYLPELRAVPHYDRPDSPGYDGQYYAQVAMRPHPGDPVLGSAVDNLPYRARRILFCWTAWALAGGDAARVLWIFPLQNVAAWLLLAVLLLRWFPPVDWTNWLRWAGVLWSFGFCVSVRGSLPDGPSLLLIAAGMALLESGRPWLAAGVLGLSGLGKETNVLAAAATGPGAGQRRAWAAAAGRWILIILPLAAWILFLTAILGPGNGTGARNFSIPFSGYLRACAGTWREGTGGSARLAAGSLLVLGALTAQGLFFLMRPRWSDPWWRLGAAYAVLMVFLGDAVWEGYPSAVSRVVLPMLLAFNILVPRGRGWWMVLLLGNVSLLASPKVLVPPGRESFRCEAPADLRPPGRGAATVEAVFDGAWYPPERSWFEYWRWTGNGGTVVFRNPSSIALIADVSFGLRSEDRRLVGVDEPGNVRWRGVMQPGVSTLVAFSRVRLEPGDTTWRFTTDRPAAPLNAYEPRPVGFSVRNLDILILGRAP